MPVELTRCRFDEQIQIGDFKIEAYPTSHDAKEPCAFRVADNGASIGCCTDTGVISPGLEEWLACCDALVLESNHCPEMLRTGPYPEMLKRRIRSKRGHLSNPDAATCIRSLSAHLHHVMLSHLSEVNNTPEKALATAREGVGLFMDEVEITLASNPGKGQDWPGRIRI
jgi:phosphoribosyl 1,2-cyclic phosphodiesterase